MSDYQVIARKFRPQTFKDVFGQEAIVTTLKNAIKFNRLAQAYLFCGSRGTGKTTLARLLAKAINCPQPTSDFEPCNECPSCREITAGASLDVLEIDGASHRGIEDIRQINEAVGYASSGNYKIYIIDEVHMLTKEAFNALLKTLEEPPPKVKFFFATTEPHKILPTILSRCQRFNLNRIPQTLIMAKLRHIAGQLKVEVEEEALHLLAQRAEGGLRDAESLFDQILAFEEGPVTVDSVTTILGLMPRDVYFEIDHAGKEGRFIKAFEIAQRIFSEGKEIAFFIEGLINHVRQILLLKISGIQSIFNTAAESEKEKYLQSAALYSREQCLDLIEYLLEAQNQLRLTTFGKTSLEVILLHVMRSHFRLPIEQLVRQLSELEQLVNEKNELSSPSAITTSPIDKIPSSVQNFARPLASPAPSSADSGISTKTIALAKSPSSLPSPAPSPAPSPTFSPAPVAVAPKTPLPSSAQNSANPFISEDPTPSSADLGKSTKPKSMAKSPAPAPIAAQTPVPSSGSPADLQHPLHVYDTLMHFAAVELDGRLQKK